VDLALSAFRSTTGRTAPAAWPRLREYRVATDALASPTSWCRAGSSVFSLGNRANLGRAQFIGQRRGVSTRRDAFHFGARSVRVSCQEGRSFIGERY